MLTDGPTDGRTDGQTIAHPEQSSGELKINSKEFDQTQDFGLCRF